MNNFVIYKIGFACFRITYNEKYILSIKITEETSEQGEGSALTEKAKWQLDRYFTGGCCEFDFPYQLNGTEFQKKVWNALNKIPYGETRTYKEIAEMIGNPRAARAVGAANNKNPMHIIVPCHRVVGKNGDLVGYAAGLDRKAKLLEMERLHKPKVLNI